MLMLVCGDEFLAACQFQQWYALLHAAASDAEKVLSVWFRESAVAFSNVGGSGQGCTVELISQEEVAAREALGQRADGIREGDSLLIDLELLECEGHRLLPSPDHSPTARA